MRALLGFVALHISEASGPLGALRRLSLQCRIRPCLLIPRSDRSDAISRSFCPYNCGLHAGYIPETLARSVRARRSLAHLVFFILQRICGCRARDGRSQAGSACRDDRLRYSPRDSGAVTRVEMLGRSSTYSVLSALLCTRLRPRTCRRRALMRSADVSSRLAPTLRHPTHAHARRALGPCTARWRCASRSASSPP